MKENKKLKIAMVLDIYDDSTNGAVMSTRRFVELLSKDHDVTIVTSGRRGADTITMNGWYPPFAASVMKKMQFRFAWPDTSALEKLYSKMDIVHVQFPFYLGRKTVDICQRLGVPVVTSFHVQPENIFYNIGIKRQLPIDLMYKYHVNRFYNKSNAVFCPSKFAQKELKKYGLKSHSEVISNGIMPQFRTLNSSKSSECSNKFTILMVGRLAREKRQDFLINAISRSKYSDRIQTVIAGTGPFENALKKMAEKLPVYPKFGFLNEKDLIKAYNNADLYVHTSEVELESLTILEAMACGLPALISDSKASAASQFALDERFLFNTSDPGSLAEHIDYWFENKDELSRLKFKYLEMSDQFYIEQSYEKLINLYTECLGQKNPNIAKEIPKEHREQIFQSAAGK